ncbi:MAG: SDR family NAD(P)-dependent oxidoreductase [Vicinamibacteria bacterium]|jgi:NAD(P)-dependent dehydrogenase (short-subunit alcohol dehydrogenase family)
MTDHDARVVVITGAAGNLGKAVARAFETLGDDLVLVDLRAEALDSAFGTGGRALRVATNLLDADDAKRMARAAVERFGRIDVLCNLAGGFRMGEDVHATSDATWKLMMDLNVTTLVNAARAVVPVMLERGRGAVVNVGAFGAQKGGAQMGAYAASKSAVMRLTESMAAELRGKGINVNAVVPTTLDTPENRKSMPDVDPTTWVAPDDLASVIEFLASRRAKAIHGALVPVTGLS